jgi:phospholipid/cholesterol/gamma-HCH transport system substrate-binding protein
MPPTHKQAFKFRFVNEIAGAFVIIAAALAILGIYFAGHAQGWFERKLVLRTQFSTKEGTYGLQEGAEVRILGTLAGEVGPIVPGASGDLETTLKLKGRFHPYVRADSIALVKRKFEVAGDAYVEITLGDPQSPLLPDGALIKCKRDVELIQAAQKVLDETRAVLLPIMEELRGTLANLNRITRKIDAAEGPVGMLISDTNVTLQVRQAVQDLKRFAAALPGVVTQANGVADDLRKASGRMVVAAEPLPGITEQADGILRDLRRVSASLTGEVANVYGLVYQTQDAVREIERLVKGLQQHWLVRGYIEPSGATEFLDAGAIRNTKGTQP